MSAAEQRAGGASAFYTWLQGQRGRADEVGTFAWATWSDAAFPRHTNRLHFLLRYAGTQARYRAAVKAAHREWRLGPGKRVRG